LFEEQLRREHEALDYYLSYGSDSFAEALSYFPSPGTFKSGPEEYLEHVRKARQAVRIPVIASLNGMSAGRWTSYARKLEEAGADALELNVYFVPTDMHVTGAEVESIYLDTLRSVKSQVRIPVAVKISPFFSSTANMAMRLVEAGADGLVLFNRFYQPDIDIENLEVRPNVILSTPQALRLPLRWIAIVYGHVNASLAATSGIHRAQDVLKLLMAGADVTMLCSVLMRKGFEEIGFIESELRRWMEEHEYESVEQMKGSMSQKHCAGPAAFERAQYMRAVLAYQR
jgi:dihydroorotate dehydrogenase (fumarate)